MIINIILFLLGMFLALIIVGIYLFGMYLDIEDKKEQEQLRKKND